MEAKVIEAIATLRNIVEDQHKVTLEHEKRIGILETKLQVYAKVMSGVDLNQLANESLEKRENA
tara:strand:- start:361 stop:552 length:192 start_codon:yes stop_codon:yes gene_type:complete